MTMTVLGNPGVTGFFCSERIGKKYFSTIHGRLIKPEKQGDSWKIGLSFTPANHHLAEFGRHPIGHEDNIFNHPTVLVK